jgi:hypothetical protein
MKHHVQKEKYFIVAHKLWIKINLPSFFERIFRIMSIIYHESLMNLNQTHE